MTATTQQYRTTNTETLAAAKVLAATDAKIQILDPGGAARNVDLPDLSDTGGHGEFLIVNSADAAEVITVRDAANSNATVGTPTQNESCRAVWTGTSWEGDPGVASTA